MTDVSSPNFEELFHKALDCEPAQRDAFLEQACGSDLELKEELISLLNAYNEDHGFHETLSKVMTDWKHSVKLNVDREDDALPFDLLGDYRLIRRLGKGGMGEVFEAEQLSIKKKVAVKILPRLVGLSRKAVEDFHKEAMLGAQLKHPNIVSIFTVDCIEGVHFIAQELVEGGRNLSSLFKDKTGDDISVRSYFRKTAERIAKVAKALQHAHERLVIHRDIKPTNILINEDDQPLVCDFGLARRMKGQSYEQSQVFSGTTPYMSPEQTKGHYAKIDHRADIFSLGATLYEALTLKRAFHGDSSNEIIENLRSVEPESMRKIDRRIPAELSAICTRAMEKNRDRRYPCMEDLSNDLESYLKGESLSPQTAGWLRCTMRLIQRRKFGLTTCAVLLMSVVMAAVLGANWVYSQYKPLRTAFEWEGFDRVYGGAKWAPHIDSRDLGWSFFETLRTVAAREHITNEHLKPSEANLITIMDHCRIGGEYALLDDVKYLLAYIKYRLEEADGLTGSREDLFSEAAEIVASTGWFNPFSTDSFLWRDDINEAVKGSLRVNMRNPKVHLYRGVAQFSILYKGGTRLDFEGVEQAMTKVLETDGRNRLALATLGRTYFFWARTFWENDHLEKAIVFTKAAIEVSKSSPSQMMLTTMGQIELLRDHFEEAKAYFENARNLQEENESYFDFNTLCGLGKSLLYLGSRQKALHFLNEAFENNKYDPHVNISLAEYYLVTGDIDSARRFAEEAIHPRKSNPTNMASAYLILARILAVQGEMEECLDAIYLLQQEATHNPKDFSLACLLCAALSEYSDETESNLNGRFRNLAEMLIQKSNIDASHLHIYRSALGAFAYHSGKFRKACEILSAARDQMHQYGFAEDTVQFKMKYASDLYFLAMAWHKRNIENRRQPNTPSPVDIFEEAEALYCEQVQKSHFIDNWDIYDLIRRAAKAVLGV